MASRARSTSSSIETFTFGAMSKESSIALPPPARAAPSSSSARNSPTCSGEKKVGSQPSAISPVSWVFFGPIAAM